MASILVLNGNYIKFYMLICLKDLLQQLWGSFVFHSSGAYFNRCLMCMKLEWEPITMIVQIENSSKGRTSGFVVPSDRRHAGERGGKEE